MLSEIDRIMGFDVGRRYIGVAVGERITGSAKPLTSVLCESGDFPWPNLLSLVSTWEPGLLVVGWPLHADGRPTDLCPFIQSFVDILHVRTSLPIQLMDERLSTWEARQRLKSEKPTSLNQKLKQKKILNATAAQVILESWLAGYGE